MKNLISVKNLSKSFGDKDILENLSLTILSGEVFGLVGLNGAGKTTLIRTLLGLIKRDLGDITILDSDPQIATGDLFSQVGVILENSGFYGNLSVRDNLKFYAKARGVSLEEFESYFESFVSQMDIYKKDTKVKHFSRGEKMQCAISRAFLGWPKILIFDEPTIGLDMNAYELFAKMVNEASKKGSAILISSHNLDAIERLCSKISILENKKLTEFNLDNSNAHWSIKFLEEFDIGEKIISKYPITDIKTSSSNIKFIINSDDEKTIISNLIKDLVTAGASIYETKKDAHDIKNSLRKYYENGAFGSD